MIGTAQATGDRMRRVRRSGTEGELAVRRAVHRRGLRYRVDVPVANLRTRPDLVFTKARLAVYIDGCFWHGCPLHATKPKSNADWWSAKLHENGDRDRTAVRRLRANGWTALRIWEHEDPERAADLIAAAIVTVSRLSSMHAPD
jgi:DNA mismatch endonuclease (patch repair protein)